jgi:hypothetical protein
LRGIRPLLVTPAPATDPSAAAPIHHLLPHPPRFTTRRCYCRVVDGSGAGLFYAPISRGAATHGGRGSVVCCYLVVGPLAFRCLRGIPGSFSTELSMDGGVHPSGAASSTRFVGFDSASLARGVGAGWQHPPTPGRPYMVLRRPATVGVLSASATMVGHQI